MPKFCHTYTAFGHIIVGCRGPKERERIRLANKRREPSQSRGPGPRTQLSRGRDIAVRGSANGLRQATNQKPEARPQNDAMVWKASGKNKTNGYKGTNTSSSKELPLANKFQLIQVDETEKVTDPVPAMMWPCTWRRLFRKRSLSNQKSSRGVAVVQAMPGLL